MRLKDATVATVAVFVLIGAVSLFRAEPYHVDLLMPSAGESFEGAQVIVGGEPIGEVSRIGVMDGQALVTVRIDDDHAPLRAGTTGRITWEAVLGARVVELIPGPKDAPELASGRLIMPNVESVSIDQLVATLDAPTRKNLQRLLQRLQGTVDGKEPELNETIQESGPTIQALGQVLSAVGQDGPAIRNVVTQLSTVASTVAARQSSTSKSIAQLNEMTTQVAKQHRELAKTIDRLPATLDAATETLDEVPGPVKDTRALLRDLEPTTTRLPRIARNLRPVLRDAKQPLADLTPLLTDADTLLKDTPGLLRVANETLPHLTHAFDKLNPMVEFLRPYTPEAASWLSNWVGIFGSQNTTGNYARALITGSATSLVGIPVDQTTFPAGQCADSQPAPGSLVNTGAMYDDCVADANGSGIQ